MLSLYLMCLVFGGVLLALSVFAGGDADVEMDAELDVDASGADSEALGEGVGAAARFLSFRDLVFFAAFFGLSGTLFTLLGVGFTVTLLTALGVGAVAGVVVHRLMDYLRSSESGALASLSDLEGAFGEIVVGVSGSKSGKVSVGAGDRTHQLLATAHEAAEVGEFRAGDQVLIVRIDNGVARVAEATFLS